MADTADTADTDGVTSADRADTDVWARWLLERRDGGDAVKRCASMQMLTPIPAAVSEGQRAGTRWEAFLRSSPNPLAPTLEEAMAAALAPDEAARFTAYLRPLVEAGERVELAHLWAMKRAR